MAVLEEEVLRQDLSSDEDEVELTLADQRTLAELDLFQDANGKAQEFAARVTALGQGELTFFWCFRLTQRRESDRRLDVQKKVGLLNFVDNAARLIAKALHDEVTKDAAAALKSRLWQLQKGLNKVREGRPEEPLQVASILVSVL